MQAKTVKSFSSLVLDAKLGKMDNLFSRRLLVIRLSLVSREVIHVKERKLRSGKIVKCGKPHLSYAASQRQLLRKLEELKLSAAPASEWVDEWDAEKLCWKTKDSSRQSQLWDVYIPFGCPNDSIKEFVADIQERKLWYVSQASFLQNVRVSVKGTGNVAGELSEKVKESIKLSKLGERSEYEMEAVVRHWLATGELLEAGPNGPAYLDYRNAENDRALQESIENKASRPNYRDETPDSVRQANALRQAKLDVENNATFQRVPSYDEMMEINRSLPPA